MAANCGLSIMVHIVIIATVLLLPLFATESLHPYTATRDLIVLPTCPAKGCTYSHETALNCFRFRTRCSSLRRLWHL